MKQLICEMVVIRNFHAETTCYADRRKLRHTRLSTIYYWGKKSLMLVDGLIKISIA